MSKEIRPRELDEVLEHELDEIVNRRRQANLPPRSNSERVKDLVAQDLVGLALSGGGVRSASFSLGLIQALYSKGILRYVDYLSTVSGGGYAGSCLSSLALHPDTKFDWNIDPAAPSEPPASKRHGTGSDKNAQGDREHDKEGYESPVRRAELEEAGRATTIAEEGAESDEQGSFPLAPLPDGQQPPRVMELIHGGTYLRRPLLFLNRYLIGVVLTNLVVLSALFMVTAFAAYLFRCLDYRPVIDYLSALGFRGDVWRAFFPSFVFFALWLIFWGISYWRRQAEATGQYARWLMTLTFVSVLLALAALLGTGDISLTYWQNERGIEPPTETVHSISKDLKTILVVLLLIALLPYLRLKDLIRSGTRPRNAVEGWVFAIASRALLYGLPLLMFGYMARENISEHNNKRFETRHGVTVSRLYDLVPLEFKNWSESWRKIDLQGSFPLTLENKAAIGGEEQNSGKLFPVSQAIWKSLEDAPSVLSLDEDGKFQPESVNFLGDRVRQSLQITDKISQFDRDTLSWQRWLQACAWLVTGHENGFGQQVSWRRTSMKFKEEVCDQINHSVIHNLRFHENFAAIGNDFPELDETDREKLFGAIEGLRLRARSIEKTGQSLDKNLSLRDWRQKRDEMSKALDELQAGGEVEAYRRKRHELHEHVGQANGEYVRLEEELGRVNWELLSTYFVGHLTDKSTVFAMVVVDADQRTRLLWAGWSAAIFLFSSMLVSLNATSLHGFYRNRLSKTWITPCPAFGRDIPLARLETTTRGAPYHLLGASLHFLGRRRDEGLPPVETFLFSRDFCGSERAGYIPTDKYVHGRYDLPNAMSISGAAVTPTQVQNPLLAALLMVSNSRLGQWLPNPAHQGVAPRWLERILSHLPPSPLRLMIGMLQRAEARDYCFIADGGHADNLGLLQLLRRRCRLMIVSDASYDPDCDFQNFIDLHRMLRTELGIRMRGIDAENIDLPRLVPDPETRLSAAHFTVARILYPPWHKNGRQIGPSEGLLIIIKPTFTGDEPVDLQRYRQQQPVFPHHPTSDQFFEPDRFESYRELGYHIGANLCDALSAGMGDQSEGGNPLAHWCQAASNHSKPTDRDADKLSDRLTADNFFAVLEQLKATDPERRRNAVHLLGETPMDARQRNLASIGLREMLQHPDADAELRARALWALGELQVNDAETEKLLLTIVKSADEETEVRSAAIEALIHIAPTSARIKRTLRGLTSDEDQEIAQRAVRAIE